MAMKKWMKWVGITIFTVGTAIGVRSCLEKKVSSAPPMNMNSAITNIMTQYHVPRAQATKAFFSYYYPREPDSNLEAAVKGYYARRTEDKLSLFWVYADNKIIPVIFKPGITDNTYTEIKEVILGKQYVKEGAQVPVGYLNPQAGNTNQPNAPNPMRMFTGR